MGRLSNLFSAINTLARSIVNKDFNRGYKFGFEEGLRKASSMPIKNTAKLSKQEYNELMEFLINRDLELCYSFNEEHPEVNGFEVRKRNFGWKDAGLTYKISEYAQNL